MKVVEPDTTYRSKGFTKREVPAGTQLHEQCDVVSKRETEQPQDILPDRKHPAGQHCRTFGAQLKSNESLAGWCKNDSE